MAGFKIFSIYFRTYIFLYTYICDLYCNTPPSTITIHIGILHQISNVNKPLSISEEKKLSLYFNTFSSFTIIPCM